MIELKRTSSQNSDFIQLVMQLDADLAARDGDEDHAFYDQFNKIDALNNVVVAYHDTIPAGCGAIKQADGSIMEIKRMYTSPQKRGCGIASKILTELEKWSVELGYSRCVLETGIRQPEAIALYQKNGYESIPNYGQYIGVENSRCFAKNLELPTISLK